MNEVTITITVRLPDGVTPDVEYTTAPGVTPGRASAPVAAGPLPAATTSDDDVPWPNGADDKKPVVSAVSVASEQCPVHHVAWKTVPAGVSKKTGKPYDAFQACPEKDCDQRPPRR